MSAEKVALVIIEASQIASQCLSYQDEEIAPKLDPFTQKKHGILELIEDLKLAISARQTIDQNRQKDVQRIERDIKKMFKEGNSELTALRAILRVDEKRLSRAVHGQLYGKHQISLEDISDREQVIELLARQILQLETESLNIKPAGSGQGRERYKTARAAREARRRQREAYPDVPLPAERPLTKEEEKWLMESAKRDLAIKTNLKEIGAGVKDLKSIAVEIRDEVKEQNIMLDEVEDQMDELIEDFETENARLDQLLAKAGGIKRLIPIVVLALILIALLIYIFQITQ